MKKHSKMYVEALGSVEKNKEYEATEAIRIFVSESQRECKRTNYARRRTGDWFLDTGSTPVWSTLGFGFCQIPL